MPDFLLPDTSGVSVSLSSLRGKYVLIDMWASWCVPCRKENPNVVKAYNRFKNSNFTILGVSLDGKRENWLNAIQKDGLRWTQMSDLKVWKSVVVELYGLHGILTNILLDPNGKIVAKNLRGPALEKKLSSVLFVGFDTLAESGGSELYLVCRAPVWGTSETTQNAFPC